MKQNLHYFFSILLTIILLSPPAAVWADDLPDYLKLKVNGGTITIKPLKTGTPTSGIQYSLDGTNWTTMSGGTEYPTGSTVPDGGYIYLRGIEANKTVGLSQSTSSNWRLAILKQTGTPRVEVSGNIMSLVDPDLQNTTTIPSAYCFYQLFYQQYLISSLEGLRLPATTITNNCYRSLCESCTVATSAPSILPAESIPDYAYKNMFYRCSKLTSGPEIKGTSVGANGCEYMFYQCTSLTTTVSTLPATTIGNYAYQSMYNGCTQLQTAPNIEAGKDNGTIGTHSMRYMFSGCTALTKAPDVLYSQKVPTQAYCSMFCNCSNLTASPVIMAKTPRSIKGAKASSANYNCANMFQNCSKLETIVTFFEEWGASTNTSYGETYKWVDGIKNYGTLWYPYNSYKTGSTRPDRGSTWYVPKSSSYHWAINVFFDYTFNAQGGSIYTLDNHTPVDNEGEIVVKRSYDNYPSYATGSAPASTRVIVMPDTALKDGGYKFYGWNIDKDATIETEDGWLSIHNEDTIGTVFAHTTYYAIYEELDSDAKITFDKDGNGTWDNEEYLEETVTLDYPVEEEDVPGISRANYELKEWNTSKTGDGTTFTIDLFVSSNMTFYPIWLPKFNFNVNNGQWPDASTGDSLMTIAEIGDLETDYPVTTRANYQHIGWNTNKTATSNNFDKNSLPGDTVTYFAIYKPLCTFDVATNGGTWDGEDNTPRAWIKDTLVAHPTFVIDGQRTNYHFVKWNTLPDGSGTDYTTPEALSGTTPVTYYAIFTPEFTFNPNGGKWEDDSTSDKVFYGSSFSVPDISKNGYTFNGWSPTFNIESLPTTPTTYTAQWTAINYTFDVATNGGTWDGSDDDNRVLTAASLPSAPVKENFIFQRWNTEADGEGDDMNAEALPSTATKYYAIYAFNYFRFVAERATTIATNNVNSATIPSLSYSTDAGMTWNTFTVGTTSVNLAAGDIILFKGVNASGLNSGCTASNETPSGSYWYFTSTDSISVAGNIMTLVQGSSPTNTIPATNCFAAIMNNLKLVSAAKLVLPTTTTASCYQYMFYRSSVRIAPESLPALNVANYAYQGMFSQCAKLKIAPEIAATTVGEGSMKRMFHTCTALTQAPSELKALTLASNSYYSMFWECSALRTAPVIRAINMPNDAMGIMFRNCSTLNNISVRMKEWVYTDSDHSATLRWVYNVASSGTFTCPSALPATTGESKVPSGWTVYFIPELTFDVSTNGGTWEDESTTARVLEPETTWTIPTDVTAPANRTFVGWNTETDGTGDWLTVDNQPVISTTAVIRTYYAIYAMNLTFNVATAGATWDGSANENRTYTDVQFRRGEIPSPQRGDIEVCSAWVTAGGDTLKSNSVLTPGTVYSPLFAEYVCITAQTDNVGVGISSIGSGSTITFNLYYSTDGMNWKKASGSPFQTINTGEKLYLRGTNANGINTTANGAAYGSNHYIKFNITNNATLSGNLMTLIHPTNPPTTIPGAYCFAKLFKNDTGTSSRYCKITDASRLKMPATTMLESCYEGMFHDCNLLVNGPKLVATTLAANCYKWLFYGCSALRRVEVAFDDWSDDGSGDPAYTYQWMSGTTTDPANNAMFVGPAALSLHARNIGHIQKGWKVANLVLQDNQPNYYYDCLRDTLSGYTLNSIVLKRNFWARSWVAFNVPFDFDILPSHPFYNNVYRFVGAEGDASQGFNIQFEGGVYHLDAGVPYLYYGTREDVIDPVFSTDDYYNDIVIKADAFNTAKAKYDGDDAEFNPSNSRFQGTVRLTTLTGGDNSIIFIYANRLYYPNSGGNTMRAFQGYFKVDGIPAGVAPRVRMMVDGQETGVEIEEFGADGQAAETGTKKYIQDGVMVIERNGVKYDAQGHKLN